MEAADHLSRAHEHAMKLSQAHDTKLAEVTLAHKTATAGMKQEVRVLVWIRRVDRALGNRRVLHIAVTDVYASIDTDTITIKMFNLVQQAAD